jgi:hypothetical protein
MLAGIGQHSNAETPENCPLVGNLSGWGAKKLSEVHQGRSCQFLRHPDIGQFFAPRPQSGGSFTTLEFLILNQKNSS